MTVAVQQFAASGVATTTNSANATFGANIQAGETVVCVVAMVDGNDAVNAPSDTAFGAYALRDSLISGVPRRVLIYEAKNHPGGVAQVTWTKAESGSGAIACWRISGNRPQLIAFDVVNRVDPGTATDGVSSGTLALQAAAGVLLGLAWRDAAAGTFNYAVGTGFTDSGAGLIWNSTGRAEHRTVTGDLAATFTSNDATLDALVAGIIIREAPAATMAATDEQDVAAAAVSPIASVDLAVVEAQDTAAADISHFTSAFLTATDPQDTAAASVAPIAGLDLAATDAQDTLAAVVVLVEGDGANVVVLEVVEAQDVAAGAVSMVAALALAAVEAQDTMVAYLLPPCVDLDFDPQAPDLENMIATAFLDRFGRYAKSEEARDVLRVFYPSSFCDTFGDIPIATFRRLPRATRDALNNAPSAAGLVDTEGKSNA